MNVSEINIDTTKLNTSPVKIMRVEYASRTELEITTPEHGMLTVIVRQ